MTKMVKEWWDGNSTKAWRLSVSVIFAILSFFGGRMYDDVRAVPVTYAEKSEVKCLEQKIENLRNLMDSKMDDITQKIDRGNQRTMDKIDDIKNFLMEK